MDKQRDNDGIWMFQERFQRDVESGIDMAIEKTGLKKGFYANKLNQQFSKVEPYLETSYTTPSGNKLGSTGRRLLVMAYCLDDTATIRALLT